MYVHIGWARWERNPEYKELVYIFVSGTNRPDKVHSWFKVYRNG